MEGLMRKELKDPRLADVTVMHEDEFLVGTVWLVP